jgi:CheY-like chemotaxis protein
MSSSSAARRIILRADLHHDEREDIAHTIEISETTVFVRTDEPADIGDRVRLRLSFPRLLAPFEVKADVVATTAAAEPGDVAGLTLEFVFDRPREQERLRELLTSFDQPDLANASATFRILLVEDSDFIRDMFHLGVRKHFRRRPATVIVDVTDDADEAWDMLRQQRYDLAIVDYYLQSHTGSHLVERVRGNPRFARLPVVGISVGGAEAREAFFRAGADLFLDKPIVLRDLYTTIELLTLTGAAA